VFQLDREKFANTVLFLLKGCGGAGVLKLVKMLYFADFEHYRRHLRPITGVQYVALKNGPVPDDYKQLFDELESSAVIRRREVPIHGALKPMMKCEALQEPNEHAFGPTEIEVLRDVLEQCRHETGNSLIERSHREGPWSWVWDPESAGKAIPYSLGRWLDNQPDDDDLETAARALESDDVQAALAALGATK
jgi:uncharacterized phage-associated protein